MDPISGFDSRAKIFRSIRGSLQLPPENAPLSATSYIFSCLPNPLPQKPAFIDATTSQSLSFPDLLRNVRNLSVNLLSQIPALRSSPHPPAAFVISPPSIQIPTLYLSLLSIGVAVSPSNPASTPAEIARQISLSRPAIIFATSSTASKIPASFPHPTILLDSPRFHSMISTPPLSIPPAVAVMQSDPAAILYSSGTTGKFKGVVLTHRNLIAVTASSAAGPRTEEEPISMLLTVPLFHVFGFYMCLAEVAAGETLVLMERFDFVAMLRAVEKYRVNYMPVSPPLVVALAKSDEVPKHNLSSLKALGCGGAPLGKDVAEKFRERFPDVEIAQGYGLTESTGGIATTSGPEECKHYGSAGRLAEDVEAKIVDPETGEGLPPGQQGELWLRGPTIMKGYIDDPDATAATLDSEGWLKTGDLCYFDHEGFLFVVDRLKELIKYKAYQVAPAELEQLLHSHPEISEAAVVPYPDEEAGQIPMAYVVRRPGSSITEAQIMDFVAKQVAPYKKIRQVAFINAIPTSAAGKILRRELINHAHSSSSSKL